LSLIDFETLPDGQPSMAGVDITEDFNYDDQGVHFSAPFPYPFIEGNPVDGFGLGVSANEETWIIADLITPAYAVGAFFPGGTNLCVFDQLGSEMFGNRLCHVQRVRRWQLCRDRLDRCNVFRDIFRRNDRRGDRVIRLFACSRAVYACALGVGWRPNAATKATARTTLL